MDYKALQQILRETSSALDERRIADAFALTEGLLQTLADSNLIDTLYSIKQNYDALLRFVFSRNQTALDGIDEQIQQVVQRLIQVQCNAVQRWLTSDISSAIGRKCYILNATAHHHTTDELLRTSRQMPAHSDNFYSTIDNLGTRLWLLPLDESMNAETIAHHPSVFAQSVFTSALTCSLLFCFDPQKLQLLLSLHKAAIELMASDASRTSHKALMARTLVGITAVYQQYLPQLQYYPRLHTAIVDAFRQSSDEMPLVWMAFLRATITPKVGEQVDSILPELKDAVEQQLLSMGNDKVPSDDVFNIHANGFFDKMMHRMEGNARKIDEMRRAGFDVNYVSAMNLKRFNFFRESIHWLYPFTMRLPWVNAVLHDENGQLDKATLGVMHHSCFCESDCYSYLAMMVEVNKGNASTLMKRMQQELSEIGDALYDDTFLNPALNLYDNYVQSLLRLLRIQPEGMDLADPFAEGQPQLSLRPEFAALLNDNVVAEAVTMLVRMGSNATALAIINHWQSNYGSTSAMLTQQGYALMQTEQWEQALRAFKQSELIDENQPDLDLLMARCHQALGQWERALACLERREAAQPDNTATTRAIGNCLIHLQRWDDAAQRFFKLELMGKSTPAVRRSIAWCLLRQGKLDKAQNYYSELCAASSPQWEDQLNLAHTYLLQADITAALEAYSRYASLFTASDHKGEYTTWHAPMADDYHSFLSGKCDPTIWYLIQDAMVMD